MKMTSAADYGFLVLILCGLGVSSAIRHVTVMEGDRLTLTCKKKPGHMDWYRKQNNRDFLLFFNDHQVRQYPDRRYSIHSFSSSDYTLVVSPVTFKDEGIFVCHHYSDSSSKVTTSQYNLTVLGAPKITFTKHEDKYLVKCSAKGNSPPKLSWQFGGIELEAQAQHIREDQTGKWTTENNISIRVLRRKVTVKCLVHHPALPGSVRVGFVTIQNKTIKQYSTPTSSTKISTWSPTPQTTNSPHLSTQFSITGETDYTVTTTMETSQYTDTNTNINATSALETTSSMMINTSSILDNTTSITENDFRNDTEINEKRRAGGSASLFISSVAALIICLLIVVAFLLVKLRKAHKKWRLEKEESDQSVESAKSKSSGEESKPKISLGFLKSNFRKYKAGEGALGKQTSASTSASTLASNTTSATASHSASQTVEVTVETHASNAAQRTQNHQVAPSPVKETEL